ncbi:MAG: HEAT repeat domain-containing protein, partial [Armatimonadetes bacterium]|nr:HEAT repeat domain-containing protein [Armatimonadota bacterium]
MASTRRRAIHLLAECPAAEAADALPAALGRASRSEAEWDTKEQAARALGALGEPRALGPLRALREQCDGVRGDLFDAALARLGDPEARRRV